MNNLVYDVVLQGMRTLYITMTPFVIVLVLAGLVTSILQTALSVQEGALNYAVRLLALVALLYVFLPTVSQTVMMLAEFAFR